MENESAEVVDVGVEEGVEESAVEDKTDGESETKSYDKPKETPEARIARLKRQLSREEKKLGKESEKPEPKSTSTKSGELDYGQKAFLVANGVKGKEEVSLVQEFMENTGKSLDDVLESKYFQSELKELRGSKASQDAIPKGSKRAGSSSKDSVDYWLAKGELPENTPENQDLRRQVVNAKYKRETSGNKFSSNTTGNVLRQSQLNK